MTTMSYYSLRLSEPGFVNPRTSSGLDDQSLLELALHIGLHGLLNPLIVTRSGLVISGQRRYLAIGKLIAWTETLVGLIDSNELDDEELRELDARAIEYNPRCPVRVVEGVGLEGLALADNIQREQLSSYEIARHLFHLHEQGATGANLARLIGKSRSYVSRKLTAWRGACPELRQAWEKGELAEDTVQDLAALPHDDQLRELAQPVPRGRRGPANRPGIDTVKQVIGDLSQYHTKNPRLEVGVARYAAGVVDALRWVAGERASGDLAKLVGGGE